MHPLAVLGSAVHSTLWNKAIRHGHSLPMILDLEKLVAKDGRPSGGTPSPYFHGQRLLRAFSRSTDSLYALSSCAATSYLARLDLFNARLSRILASRLVRVSQCIRVSRTSRKGKKPFAEVIV